MKEIKIQEFLTDKDYINDDFLLPLLNDYDSFLRSVMRLVEENVSSEKSLQIKKDLTRLNEILIDYGATYENVVLKTAIIYYLTGNEFLDYEKLSSLNLSKIVVKGVNILQQANNQNDYKRVFLSSLAYLGKIQLALTILEIEKANKNDNKSNILIKANKIISQYQDKVKNSLMVKLIETKNNI